MKVTWKDVVGYEALYRVNNLGEIKSLERVCSNGSGIRKIKSKTLKQFKNKGGYLQVRLSKNGKSKLFLVSRIVATAFLGNPKSLYCVNHIDENKTNNNVENLEWCTLKENTNHGTNIERIRKAKERKVIELTTSTIYESGVKASRETGVNHANIIQCCNFKRKSAGKIKDKKRIWRYVVC